MQPPRRVTEVAPDRPEDHRPRVGGECIAPVRRVSIHGPDQPDAGRLVKVLDRLAATLIIAREPARERQVPHDDRLPRAGVPGRATAEQRPQVAGGPVPWRDGIGMPMQRHMFSLAVAPTELADGLAIGIDDRYSRSTG